MRYLRPAIALLAVLGCVDARPSEEDRRLQLRLEEQFGDYDFAMEDIYLIATRKVGEPTRSEAAAISKAFWTEPAGRLRTDTVVAYLNLHAQGGFRFQAYYDRSSGTLKFGTTQHY